MVGIKVSGGGLPVNATIDREFKDSWRYDSGKWKHLFSKNQP